MSNDNVTPLQPKWQEKVEDQAKEFSRDIERVFRKNMDAASKFLPKAAHLKDQMEEMQLFQVNSFIRYMVATNVAILMKVTGIDENVEAAFINQVKDTFVRCRALKQEGKL